MLGLRRHTVRLAAHDPTWAASFRAEQVAIEQALGELALAVEHVGSTAVPGIPAKPILDIAIALAHMEAIEAVVERLEPHDYVYRGDGGDDGGHLFIKDSAPDVRIAHAHAVVHDDPQWQSYLVFRDRLRGDDATRAAYVSLKRALAERFPDDREAYTSAKHDFIRGVIRADGR